MRFDRLDLNLLVALDVLIEERNVSVAAKRLHLSQPAVSGALNRLREFFGDELLVQVGRQMVLTSKAEELAPAVQEALMLIRTRITTPARFDPATAERRFRVIASDYVFTVMLSETFAKLGETSPGITFELMGPEPRTIELLERGEADLLITIDTHIKSEFPSVFLFEDTHAVICWSGSDYAAGVDAQQFSAAGHAVSYIGPARFQAFAEIFFDRHKVERRGEMYVPSFTMLPQAVIGTQRLATLQRRYAEYWARHLPIVVHPVPFDMPKLREAAQWHPMREKDAGLAWLVDIIQKDSMRLHDPSAG
jgi:DNA-binding transcriptional LysR family regulator